MIKAGAAMALVKRFIDVDPQQAAHALEGLSEQDAAAVLRGLAYPDSARCLERVRPAFAAGALAQLPAELAAEIVQRMGPDHAADVMRDFAPAPRQAVVDRLPEQLRREMQEMLSFPADSAGRLMRSDYLAFHQDLAVRDVVARLRTLGGKGQHSYLYVIGPEKRLVGVLNLRDLLLASPDVLIAGIMHGDVFAVGGFTDREELLNLVGNRPFLSVPVVDAQGRLIGTVKMSDLLESSQAQATEDVQLLFGASGEERAFSPLRFKVAQRLPWLYINLLTAFLAGAVVALFENLIARVAVLAVFLPIIAGQGGNAGIQTLAVVLRGLVMREVRPRDAAKLIAVEISAGAINGLAIGIVTGGAAWLWRGNPMLGVVVGLAMLVNMVAAGLAGAAIPLAMKKLGFDPAQASGIFLTTVTDVVGFLSFLGFAALCVSRLK